MERGSRLAAVARPVIGAILGLFIGGVFDFLYVNASWSPNSLRLMFGIQVAFGVGLIAVAAWRGRSHGFGIAEGVLLGVAASIAICWVLLIWVVVGRL